MNRIETAAGVGLLALVAGGLVRTYHGLATLAATPAPPPHAVSVAPAAPAPSLDETVASYLNSRADGDGRTRLANLLAVLESPEFETETIRGASADELARTVVEALGAPEGVDADLQRRAVGFLAGRVPGKVSRDFVLAKMEEGPAEVRVEAIKRVGSPKGVRGAAVYEKVLELAERGLAPDADLPQALRRTGGRKARSVLTALMSSTDSAKLIRGCAVALQDYHDPELLAPVLERLEQVGLLDDAGKLPWLSARLLDEHLRTADKASFRRGMIAMSARPGLVKSGLSHAERGLQSLDADTRRYAAIAVKKAVVAKILDAKQGENLLAGRLQVETEPVLKAELTGGLERIHSLLDQPPAGVQ